MSAPPESETPAIEVIALDFSFGGPQILTHIDLSLPRGSRTLLIGANGAGKSTLLRIIAGKHLVKAQVSALGRNTFNDTAAGITYLGSEWVNNPVVRSQVPVSRLLKTLGAERNRERCEVLLDILNVNPDWNMHEISDGQRRRVQIVLGLLEPWTLLLLDEVTVDLDVLVRYDLLNFLKSECETRNATVLYATHIFDGLGGWPTHLAHISHGSLVRLQSMADPFPELEEMVRVKQESQSWVHNSPLLMVVEQWLRKDAEEDKSQRLDPEGRVMTRWDVLSENMKVYGDKFYNYWR